jgi:hypothetical protein
MRIEFVRSGGFAGLFLTANIDLQTLPPDESATFEREINDTAFFELPEQIKSSFPMPDRFEYQITVTSPQRTHTVTVSESLVTDALRLLVDHLTDLARTGKYR